MHSSEKFKGMGQALPVSETRAKCLISYYWALSWESPLSRSKLMKQADTKHQATGLSFFCKCV